MKLQKKTKTHGDDWISPYRETPFKKTKAYRRYLKAQKLHSRDNSRAYRLNKGLRKFPHLGDDYYDAPHEYCIKLEKAEYKSEYAYKRLCKVHQKWWSKKQLWTANWVIKNNRTDLYMFLCCEISNFPSREEIYAIVKKQWEEETP